MRKIQKWFTCTPKPFLGNSIFFARDSGLLCKGFQEIGIDCKAVLPGLPKEDDQVADLIRTDYKNLEDSTWWAALGGDGVVFYGWGSGKYVKIAHAIKQAGLILVSNMDTGGMLGILNGFPTYAGHLWRLSQCRQDGNVGRAIDWGARLTYASTAGLLRNDWPRSRHLLLTDIVGAVSPVAMERIKKVCGHYAGEKLAQRVFLIPHPVAPYMTYSPSVPKERLVVTVGRWDDPQKGTDILIEAVENLVSTDNSIRVEIYGNPGAIMEAWHRSLSTEFQLQIRLKGVVPNALLRDAFMRARVFLCSSIFESFHIGAAESLCCGCSVVGPDVPEFSSIGWFTDGPYGCAVARSADGLAAAVLVELALWDDGQRNPEQISAHWGALLHAPNVARLITELVNSQLARPTKKHK